MLTDAFEKIDCGDRSNWLSMRNKGIGGSDASSIVGTNPYRNNQELWSQKLGLTVPEDISNKDYVIYGTLCEDPIREIFKLDYAETYKVTHDDNMILRSTKLPFLQASLDGELVDQEGRKGILEIKTSNILQSMQREKWNEKIPDNYYTQVLHYLLVTGYDFAVLRAHLRTVWDGQLRTSIKDYFIERKEVESDMRYLLGKEIDFWRCVETKVKPNLVLPNI